MKSNKDIFPDPQYSSSLVLNRFQIQADEGMETTHPDVHSHTYYEIIYCRSNCGAEFRLGSRVHSLQRGDILVIPPETTHRWVTRSRNGEPYMGYRLCIEPEYISWLRRFAPDMDYANCTEFCFLRTVGTVWESLGEIFRAVYEETHFKSPGWKAASVSGATYLLIQLGRAILTNPISQAKQEKNDLLEPVLSYVKSHLGEKITLDDVARRFWVSSSTITHLFSKRLGISFYKYVTRMRLTEAKNLIAEGMPMEKIAQQVGFNDYSAFYRAFKKEFDISPKQYLQTFGK